MHSKNIENVINKPYLDVGDISYLLMCSKSKAFKIKSDIKKKLKAENKMIFDSRYLPTKEVIDYLDNDYFNRLYYLEKEKR